MLMKTAIKIAGVTLANADGISRQEILKFFGVSRYITVNLIKRYYFNPKTGKKELSIACIEKSTKSQLGFIPEGDITQEIKGIRQMTGLVGHHASDDTYYCELTETQAPSSETYAYVKEICESKNLLMPIYDMRAYAQFYDWLDVEHKT